MKRQLHGQPSIFGTRVMLTLVFIGRMFMYVCSFYASLPFDFWIYYAVPYLCLRLFWYFYGDVNTSESTLKTFWFIETLTFSSCLVWKVSSKWQGFVQNGKSLFCVKQVELKQVLLSHHWSHLLSYLVFLGKTGICSSISCCCWMSRKVLDGFTAAAPAAVPLKSHHQRLAESNQNS